MSLERIDELFDWYPGDYKLSNKNSLRESINLANVSFQYPTRDLQGVFNINLEVKIGQTIAIVGKTGCGKTTLVKILLGFLPAQEGSIFLDGKAVYAESLHGAMFSSAAFNNPFIFNSSVKENITMDFNEDYGHKKTEELLKKVTKIACVDEFLPQLPQGIDTIIGDFYQGLSSGQKQRIALARALFKQPKLLILDEATDSIDSETEEKIFESLYKDKSDFASVIISHRLSSIARSDLIYYMEDGKVHSIGTHSNLMAECPGYKALFTSQLFD
ncbi:MAG: ATP-binding cassette domain-containing protein [Anaerolineaceae bacterium]